MVHTAVTALARRAGPAALLQGLAESVWPWSIKPGWQLAAVAQGVSLPVCTAPNVTGALISFNHAGLPG